MSPSREWWGAMMPLVNKSACESDLESHVVRQHRVRTTATHFDAALLSSFPPPPHTPPTPTTRPQPTPPQPPPPFGRSFQECTLPFDEHQRAPRHWNRTTTAGVTTACFWRHEQQSIAMNVATATHHSALPTSTAHGWG